MKQPIRTWKDLQRTRDDLETIYNKQEMTWNNPQQVRMSRTLTNHRTAGKGRAYFFFASLYHFQPLHKSFNLQRLQLWERFNDERGRRKWIQEPHYIPTFFYIKIFIQVNKGAGSLDLLLNISFQPSIIAVKHSIIKVDVTELLDLPQVFTCWES